MEWRNNPVNVLHEWWGDGSWAIFNEASGQTHILNLIAYDSLNELSLRPLSMEVLIHYLSNVYPEDIISEEIASRNYLDAMINELDFLGLIEPCNL
ncbi:MAG: hypothetical protein RKR03_16460 [Candidatus Competibacter sp.]|nr:hypothetical protein [Candidatus Competibacter sp.]